VLDACLRSDVRRWQRRDAELRVQAHGLPFHPVATGEEKAGRVNVSEPPGAPILQAEPVAGDDDMRAEALVRRLDQADHHAAVISGAQVNRAAPARIAGYRKPSALPDELGPYGQRRLTGCFPARRLCRQRRQHHRFGPGSRRADPCTPHRTAVVRVPKR
jgi:hypothetical protein